MAFVNPRAQQQARKNNRKSYLEQRIATLQAEVKTRRTEVVNSLIARVAWTEVDIAQERAERAKRGRVFITPRNELVIVRRAVDQPSNARVIETRAQLDRALTNAKRNRIVGIQATSAVVDPSTFRALALQLVA